MPHFKLKHTFLVIKATAHTNLVSLKPQETGEFVLEFKPPYEGLFNCQIKLHIVNNPYETFTVI